jgi:hypothetical protein
MEVTVVRPRTAASIAPMIEEDTDGSVIINDTMSSERGRTLMTRISSLPIWRLFGTSNSPMPLSSQPYTWPLLELEIENDPLFDGLHTLTITWQSHSRSLSGASASACSWQELHAYIPTTLRPVSRAGPLAAGIDSYNSKNTNNDKNNDDEKWITVARLHDDINSSNGVWTTSSHTLQYDDLKACTRGTRFRLIQRYSLHYPTLSNLLFHCLFVFLR